MKDTMDRITLDWDEVLNPEMTSENAENKVSAEDVLMLSLNYTNGINIDYMAGMSGLAADELIERLRGIIYQNPETWEGQPYKGWETKDEYLSGNLFRKYHVAKKAQAIYGCFSQNLMALEQVMPEPLKKDEIYVSLGTPWVPTHIIDEFIDYLFSRRLHASFLQFESCKVKYDHSAWEIPNKTRYGRSVLICKTYGTQRLNALQLLEMALNVKTAVVYDEIESALNRSGKAHVLNEEETFLALEKQKLLIKEFRSWVFQDTKRSEELRQIYMEKYACIRQRVFDGSYLTFPGMSVELYPYQKDAVARILTTPNTLLAHEVGAGKTYIMAAAGMKLRSLGLSKKNLYVVPNNIVGQWEDIFLKMFPEAKLLTVEPKIFRPANRRRVLEEIRDGDYDAIIIAYSCFDLIPLSKNYYVKELEEKKEELEKLIKSRRKSTSAAKAKYKRVCKELSKLVVETENTEMICFDMLCIDRLFVDEAHNYKNMPLEGKGSFSLGFGSGSRKCQHMLDIVRYVQGRTNGGGVIMATGTPITNSISDIYVMQRYLLGGTLELLGLQTIDSWVGMFAEQRTEFEIDVDTSSYRLKTRLSRFHNLPVLTDLIASFTDFHPADPPDGMPVCDRYEDVVLEKSPALEAYLDQISARTEAVRKRKVRSRDDNLLQITNDGRKAALDIRLVDPDVHPGKAAKVFACADNVYQIYQESESVLGVQLVFCDLSTPKEGFNLYDELKKELVRKGIPEKEIAFIHDAETVSSRERLFEKVRKGKIRVLLGSTMKLGTGVNVQDRLVALHSLDVPWRPSDITQRLGRIIRKGNRNEKVQLLRYVTKGSLDAYSWQILERKQRFIEDILSGTVSVESVDDVGDTVLSYAEIKALCIGNPKLKARCDVANELYRYQVLQRKLVESGKDLLVKLEELSASIENGELYLQDLRHDAERYREWKEAHPRGLKKNRQEWKKQRHACWKKLEAALQTCMFIPRDLPITEYKGFTLILPANMLPEEPYLIISGQRQYRIDLNGEGDDPLTYIDAFLGKLNQRVKNQEEMLEKKKIEKRQMEMESNTKNYADVILMLTHKLAAIDEELGIRPEG